MMRRLCDWKGSLKTVFVSKVARQSDGSYDFKSSAANDCRMQLISAIEACVPAAHEKKGELHFESEQIKETKQAIDALKKDIETQEHKYADERKAVAAAIAECEKETELTKVRIVHLKAQLAQAYRDLEEAMRQSKRGFWSRLFG